MNLSACIQEYLDAHVGELAPTSIKWYKSHLSDLSKALGSRDITTITITDLRRWRADVIQHQTRYDDHPNRPRLNGRGLSPHTVRGKITACKALFTWLVDEGILESNPATRLTHPRKPRSEIPKAIPDEDILKLHDYTITHNLPREHALLHVLAETGARVAGIANLDRADVNLKTGCIIVTEKGEKTRPVYLTPAGIDAVRDWLRVRPMTDHNSLWTGRTTQPLTTCGIYQALKRLAKQCNVQRFNPHAFRHAYAREMLNAGLSLDAVAGLMGHSSVAITAENYAIWTQKELADKQRDAARKRNLWDNNRSE